MDMATVTGTSWVGVATVTGTSWVPPVLAFPECNLFQTVFFVSVAYSRWDCRGVDHRWLEHRAPVLSVQLRHRTMRSDILR